MTLVLYLLRHADAGDPAAWAGDDADRPLSNEGRRQARRLGKHLEGLRVDAGMLLTSPKLRAAETARLVGEALGAKPVEERRLSSGFDHGALREILRGTAAPAATLMLVGHDPDVSSLASWLTASRVELRKGALARIDLADHDAGSGSGALRWLIPPDALPG